ncbi:MAG: GAF domain-containing protein, partial [Anaerolineae bacterium]|nr:GAF domain-containing protein [Anaerolineae bacterium]
MTTSSEKMAVADHSELWRLEQLALVSQVATQVTRILDLEELFVRVVGLIYQTFEFYVVSLYTLEGETLVVRAQAGPAATFRVEDAYVPQRRSEIPLGKGIIGWVAEHQQELVVRDVSQETRFRYAPEWPKTQAEVALPLKVESRLLGVLDVQLDYPEAFDEADMLVLRTLAGQVSMAIEDTRLYAEAERRGDYLAMISAVSEAIVSILEVDAVLKKVGQLIQSYFNYPCVQLFTVNYGLRQIEFKAGSGGTAEALLEQPVVFRLNDPHNLIAAVARTGETVLVDS